MGCVWSSIPVAIFKPLQQTHIYLCMHFINNLFLDHVNSYNHLVIIIYGISRKKDNKKAS